MLHISSNASAKLNRIQQVAEDYSVTLEGIMVLGIPNINYFRITVYGHS